MPKNKGKGGKNRRRGKNENENMKRELILKDNGQSYAQVTRILGSGYIEAFCFDNTGGKKRLCHIRGKLRKKVWINQGDVILVGLRDYQDDKADVLMKYLSDEARELKRLHEIPDSINIAETSTRIEDGMNDIVFDDTFNNEESSNDANVLSTNSALQKVINDSLSEEESDDDDDEDDSINFYNPNQLTKQTRNLNAKNLLRTKKSTGKGIRNNRYTAASGSDSETNNQLARI
ncbi:unnamed protein product [Rotaria magnacalcarata]